MISVAVVSARAAATSSLSLFLLFGATLDAQSRDGIRFDPGAGMTARAAGAPAELDRVTGFVGQWKVEIDRPSSEEDDTTAAGRATFSFMNRGHAVMENLSYETPNGHELSAIHFLGFNPASQRWFLGGADNWNENAWVADGSFSDQTLVLTDIRRVGGGISLTEVRTSLHQPSADRLEAKVEVSTDGGKTYNLVEHRKYSRQAPTAGFMKATSTFGSSTPDRFPEAAEFDFLIGDWSSTHDMTFPNGQRAQWVANSTAVYALEGSAIMEFNWFDTDPNLPDAATTILRIYNRGMRRWESLFVANRNHSILYFGGVREGDEIVLHPFTAGSSGTLSRWVFFDIREDAYSWYAESSIDRGATWNKSWRIEVARKPPEPE